MKLLARKVFRIGVQSLWIEGGDFFVSIQNRTYKSMVPIPREKAHVWWARLQ